VTAITVQELIEGGVHFGHKTSRWNPKMQPYIYTRRNMIHIIDVRETLRGLLRAKKYLSQVAAGGSLILYVGTKRQAAEPIEREARRAGMPYVSERWLGGTLTNFRTIRSRLSRLEELEAIMQGDQYGTYSKKAQSSLRREYRKMFRNLNGIRTLNRPPECMIVVDPRKESNAIREARSLGVTTVAVIDTDCDPDVVDLPIPANDDSIRSIDLLMRFMTDAVMAGKESAGLDLSELTAPLAPQIPVDEPKPVNVSATNGESDASDAAADPTAAIAEPAEAIAEASTE
jgi:small subunit ribosomal protein S2